MSHKVNQNLCVDAMVKYSREQLKFLEVDVFGQYPKSDLTPLQIASALNEINLVYSKSELCINDNSFLLKNLAEYFFYKSILIMSDEKEIQSDS